MDTNGGGMIMFDEFCEWMGTHQATALSWREHVQFFAQQVELSKERHRRASSAQKLRPVLVADERRGIDTEGRSILVRSQQRGAAVSPTRRRVHGEQRESPARLRAVSIAAGSPVSRAIEGVVRRGVSPRRLSSPERVQHPDESTDDVTRAPRTSPPPAVVRDAAALRRTQRPGLVEVTKNAPAGGLMLRATAEVRSEKLGSLQPGDTASALQYTDDGEWVQLRPAVSWDGGELLMPTGWARAPTEHAGFTDVLQHVAGGTPTPRRASSTTKQAIDRLARPHTRHVGGPPTEAAQSTTSLVTSPAAAATGGDYPKAAAFGSRSPARPRPASASAVASPDGHDSSVYVAYLPTDTHGPAPSGWKEQAKKKRSSSAAATEGGAGEEDPEIASARAAGARMRATLTISPQLKGAIDQLSPRLKGSADKLAKPRVHYSKVEPRSRSRQRRRKRGSASPPAAAAGEELDEEDRKRAEYQAYLSQSSPTPTSSSAFVFTRKLPAGDGTVDNWPVAPRPEPEPEPQPQPQPEPEPEPEPEPVKRDLSKAAPRRQKKTQSVAAETAAPTADEQARI